MSRWWGRTVAGCSSVAVLAGVVAVTAAAVDADRALASTAEGNVSGARTSDAGSPGTGTAPVGAAGSGDGAAGAAWAPSAALDVGLPAARDGGPRAGTDASASVAVPPGWRDAATQRVVPVTPGRFETVVVLADRAVVLVGGLDGASSAGPAEARRMAGSAADALVPDGRAQVLGDAADTVDGRPAWTTTLRTPPGGSSGDGSGGALVRVTTVAGGGSGPGLVLLAVVRAGADQATEAATADAVARSMRAQPDPGRAAVRPTTDGASSTGR